MRFRCSFVLLAAVSFSTVLLRANPITLTVSSGGNTQTFNSSTGFVSYLGPVGQPTKPLFFVNIGGGTQPVLPAPAMLALGSIDYKTASNCSTNCLLNVSLFASGFTGSYTGFQSSLNGMFLEGGSTTAHYTLQAFLNPLSGPPILLSSCFGTTGSPASCQMFTPYNITGPFGETLTLSLDSNIGAGVFTNSYILGSPVPEPGSLVLLGSGLLGFAGIGRKLFNK